MSRLIKRGLEEEGSVGDRVRGLDAGADDYLVKPFSLLELGARLRALARRDDRARPVVLSSGDLLLNPATKQAWRGSDELKLSPKEFALLETVRGISSIQLAGCAHRARKRARCRCSPARSFGWHVGPHAGPCSR